METQTTPQPTSRKITTKAQADSQSDYSVQGFGDGEEIRLTIAGQDHWIDLEGICRLVATDSSLRSNLVAYLKPAEATDLLSDLLESFPVVRLGR